LVFVVCFCAVAFVVPCGFSAWYCFFTHSLWVCILPSHITPCVLVRGFLIKFKAVQKKNTIKGYRKDGWEKNGEWSNLEPKRCIISQRQNVIFNQNILIFIALWYDLFIRKEWSPLMTC
jgi:hypothetical protein